MFPVLHLTGFTYHSLSVLLGLVLLLEIFTFATEQLQRKSLNKDTDVKNFAKLFPNFITEIFLSLTLTNIIWNLSCNKVFLTRNFMVTWFTNFVRFLDMYILIIFFTNVSTHSPKKIMTKLYRNALLVWLSIPLQSIAMPFYLVVRWHTGFSTTWWCILNALNRVIYVRSLYPTLSVVP